MAKVSTKTQNKSLFQVVPKKNREFAQAALESAPFYKADGNVPFGMPEIHLPIEDIFADRLVTRADVVALESIVDMIYPKTRYTPTQLAQTNQDLIDTTTMVKYAPRDQKELVAASIMACVMKEWRNSFKIFIHQSVENEAYDSVDLHEKGHVYFNHLSNPKQYLSQFKAELEKIWDLELGKYFDAKSMKNSKDKIVKLLYTEFSNIAQDMEINSKLFDNGEWVKGKKTMARSGVVLTLNELKDNFDELSGLIKDTKARKIKSPAYKKIATKFCFIVSNIVTRINGEEGDFQFCYPENKGWPNKLDWMTYMVLLVKDLENTMEQVMKNIADKLGAKGMPCPSSGQGTGGGKSISEDVLNSYDEDAAEEDEAMEAANEDAGIGDDEDDMDYGMANASPTGRNEGGEGKGRGHGKVQVEFETCDTFDSFTKFLRKTCLGKKNRKWNSDVLYNSNRGKFSSKVVVPRRHLTERWMPTEVHIIVDVSGSVPTDYVERVINSIVANNSGVDLTKSHIVFCDTKVVSDEIMSKRTKSVYAGGGTEIANGIKYVKEKGYCSKKTDKLFIISDFEDTLSKWVEEARDIPGQKYAIGYNVHTKKQCDNLFDHQGYRSEENNPFKQKWNQVFKTVFILENIRGRNDDDD